MTVNYLERFFEGIGQSEWQMRPSQKLPMLFGMPRYAARQFCEERLRTWGFSMFRGPGWARSLRQMSIAKGIMNACRAEARECATQRASSPAVSLDEQSGCKVL
jgi:hypothetical protein